VVMWLGPDQWRRRTQPGSYEDIATKYLITVSYEAPDHAQAVYIVLVRNFY